MAGDRHRSRSRSPADLGIGHAGRSVDRPHISTLLALVYASSNRWMFGQPHEYVLLFILAIVPAGRYWGIDGALL